MGQAQDLFSRVVTWSNSVMKYDWQTYAYVKTLGVGAFGEVYLVYHKTTRKVYALKKIKCGSNDDLKNVTEELKSMSKLSHPNIMRLHETLCKQKEEFSAEIYIILEFCPGGTLGDRLEKPSTRGLSITWMRQLAHAVSYLHTLALVHRDLKPDNILLDAKGNIKVGDFGLSRGFLAAKRENQTWENYYMSDACGTLFYMAPEVFEGHYTEKADVFAMGVMLYAIWERESVEVNGMRCFGIFIRLSDEDRAPLGLQMYIDKTGLRVPFKKSDAKMAQIIGSTLLFDQKNRADADTIYQKLKKYV